MLNTCGCSNIHYSKSGFSDSSALLKHELAYVLGQINNPSAIPTLTAVLENMEEDPMVRHEVMGVVEAGGQTGPDPFYRLRKPSVLFPRQTLCQSSKSTSMTLKGQSEKLVR